MNFPLHPELAAKKTKINQVYSGLKTKNFSVC